VSFEHVGEVHTVKLIAGDDEIVRRLMGPKVDEILPHRVGSALVPTRVNRRLFCGEDLHKSVREMVEIVGVGYVQVQRCRIELGQNVDSPKAGVDTVRDGDVDDTVFPPEGNSRL